MENHRHTYEEGFLILLVTDHIASYRIPVLRCSIVRKDKKGGSGVGGRWRLVFPFICVMITQANPIAVIMSII
jgi:hypothetical protein